MLFPFAWSSGQLYATSRLPLESIAIPLASPVKGPDIMDCRVPSEPRTSTVPLASETRILPGENPLGDEAAAGSKNSSATPKRTAPYDPYEVRTVMRTRIGKLHSSCQSRQAALNQGVTCKPTGYVSVLPGEP